MSGTNGATPSITRQPSFSLTTLLAAGNLATSFSFSDSEHLQQRSQMTRTTCDDEDGFDGMPRLDPMVETHPRSVSRSGDIFPSFHNPLINSGMTRVAVNTRTNTSTSTASEENNELPSRRSCRLASKTRESPSPSDSESPSSAPVVETPSSESSSRKRPSVASVSTSPGDSSIASSLKSPPSKKRRTSAKKPPPNAKKETEPDCENKEGDNADDAIASCAICMCKPSKEEESKINGCAHTFCFSCIGKWADRENTCPLCKSRFNKISRVHTQRRKKNGPSVTNTKRVKQRDQRSDIVSGAALEGLLASIAMGGVPTTGLRRGRLFISGTGSASFFPLMQSHRTATGIPSFSLEHMYDNNDEDEDEVSMLPGFMSFIMRGRGNDDSSSPNPMHFSFPFAAATAAAARSYASNGGDPSAGQGVNNPLEIDDSEDEDDVEVLQVTRSA